jgi:HEAT repeat protein
VSTSILIVNPAEVTTLLADARAAAIREDEEARWRCVVALQAGGSETAFRQAAAWSTSPLPLERALGADILGQIGGSGESSPFRDRSLALVVPLLRDPDVVVLRAATVALSHLGLRDRLEPLIALATHPDGGVRHGVVLALSGNDAPLAIATLIQLSADEDDHVRDWATFGLGSQTDIDIPELRAALAACLDDPNADVRAEAFTGLARVRDARAHAPILRELQSECVGKLAVEAARDFPSPALLDALLQLRSWWDVDSELLESAIARCREAR